MHAQPTLDVYVLSWHKVCSVQRGTHREVGIISDAKL